MDKNYELILFLLSKHYPDQDFESMDDYDVYEWFYGRYGIPVDLLDDLIKDLLPLCAEGISPLTEKKYKGFASDNMWLVNIEKE